MGDHGISTLPRAMNKHGTAQTLFYPIFSAQGSTCLVPYAGVGMEAPSGHWNSEAPKIEFTCQVGGPWAR